MDKSEFRQMCTSHGLRMVSDTLGVGTERGMLFSLQWTGKRRVRVNIPIQKGDKKLYAGELRSRLREVFGRNASAVWNTQALILAVSFSSAAISDVYCQGVTAVLDNLKAVGMAVPNRCRYCGRSGCDAAVPQGAVYVPVHRSCLQNRVSGARARADRNGVRGSYILGTIGALIGAVIGMIPSALTVILGETVYMVLFILIPLCAYAGYRLCRGRMNYFALAVTVLFSVLSVYFLVFGVQLYYIAGYYGLNLPDFLTLFLYMAADLEVWIEVTRTEEFIRCFLFMVVGIFLIWGQISRTAKTDVKNASDLLGSAIPYGQPLENEYIYDPADYIRDE